MVPHPLHPAVVHFPIVLVLLLPVLALGAIIWIRRGARPRAAWALPLAAAAALTLSAWVAVQTGERDEDRVERVVPEAALERHEEAAERFLVLSGVLLLVAGAGLAGGVIGSSARAVATAGALGLVIAGYQVGGSGGELVYQHGAASAYTSSAPAQAAAAPEVEPARRRKGDDD